MRWLERSLITCQYCIALALNERDFQRELARLKLPIHKVPRFVNAGADATTHFLDGGPTNKDAAIVCLREKRGTQRESVYGLLVHEAVHIWQAHHEAIGEDKPSLEFEAYSIQAISQQLIAEYHRQKRRR